MPESAERRFWRQVSIEDRGYVSACHIWMGARDGDGYGVISINDRLVKTHIFAFERVHGPVPTGLVLDHKCRTRECCREDHLEPVTSQVNTLRGVGPTALNAQKTHCPAGHPYDVENTIQRPDGRRGCRACERGLPGPQGPGARASESPANKSDRQTESEPT